MKAVHMQTETGQVLLIEISENVDVIDRTSGGGIIAHEEAMLKTLQRLADVGSTIADVCVSVQRKVRAALGDSKPAELTLEFGVKLAGEAAIPLITSSSIEGTFQVTAKWDYAKK